MGLIVLAASALSLMFVIHGLLAVPIEGSFSLFIAGTTLYLLATTSQGIFVATQAGSMPQFGLLLMLALLPLQVLSGTLTPRESMPELIRDIMLAAPNTHFVMMAQSILFRGAGLDVVWPQFAALFAIGAILFLFSLRRFRQFLK
jgi:ABC-2 type transport system permease protein